MYVCIFHVYDTEMDVMAERVGCSLGMDGFLY